MVELLARLADKQPEHPLLAALAPLTEQNDQQLKQKARHYYENLLSAKLHHQEKRSLLEVFESLMMSRFTTLRKKELLAMLIPPGSLKKSLAYQEIFAEGETKGIAKGKAEARAEARAEVRAEAIAEARADFLHGLIREEEERVQQLDIDLKNGFITVPGHAKYIAESLEKLEGLRRELAELNGGQAATAG